MCSVLNSRGDRRQPMDQGCGARWRDGELYGRFTLMRIGGSGRPEDNINMKYWSVLDPIQYRGPWRTGATAGLPSLPDQQ